MNKNQLILLCILVSFVTSIATGVLTVSLLKEPDQPISQTINKVIERTIERVVSAPPVERVVTKEVTVIVTEEDLIMKVVNTASSSLVRINKLVGDKISATLTGFAVGNDLIATVIPAGAEDNNGYASAVTWRAETAGNNYDLSLVGQISPITVFRLGQKTAKALSAVSIVSSVISGQTGVATDTFTPLHLSSDLVATIGQTVVGIGLSGLSDNTVAVGIISSLNRPHATSTSIIKTNAATADNSGGPLLNIKAEVIGIIGQVGESWPAGRIKAAIDSIKK